MTLSYCTHIGFYKPHKNPFKERYIAEFNQCSTTPLFTPRENMHCFKLSVLWIIFFENPYRLYTVGCIDRILSNTKLVLFIHKTNISKRVLRQFPYQYEKVKIMYVSFLFKSYLLFCLYER